MNNREDRIKVLIKLSIPIIGIVLGVGLLLLNYIINRSPYGDEYVKINSINQYTKGLTDKQNLDYIQHDLYQTISYNLKDTSIIKNISDTTIRDGSFSEKYDESRLLYDVSFIVDIPSIQQSYAIRYQWGESPQAKPNEWGTQVSCLPKDQLIYGDFNCQDMTTRLNGSNDPIMKHSPYDNYAAGFKLNANLGDSGKVASVDIYIYSCHEKEINKIKETINSWFVEHSLDINNYVINYRSC